MGGGAISGNEAANWGGGVYINGAFRMSGGKVSGNDALNSYGDGVCFSDGTLELSGEAYILDELFLDKKAITSISDAFAGRVYIRPAAVYSEMEWWQVLPALPMPNEYPYQLLNKLPILCDETGVWMINRYGQLERKGDAVAKVAASGEPDAFFATLDEAMVVANFLGTATVTVLADANLLMGLPILNGSDVTLTSEGSHTVSRSATCLGPMLLVLGTLRLKGGLTLDGGDASGDENRIAQIMPGGRLEMSSGVTLTGGNAGNGGAVYNQGTFRMFGGTITENAADGVGGGVETSGGVFRMTGGTISENTADNGGGVNLSGGSMTLSGGEIIDNEAYNGGGVHCWGGATTLSGTAIRGNEADLGGGVYVRPSVAVTIKGGAFEDNAADDGGGLYAESAVTLNTDDLFANSTLFFSVAPQIDQIVCMQMSGSGAAGKYAVKAAVSGWLAEGDFWLISGMEAYKLIKVVAGSGEALQLWWDTDTWVTMPDVTYGEPLNYTATVTADVAIGATPTITYAVYGTDSYGSAEPVNVGRYRIKAAYAGDATHFYAPSEDTDGFRILPAMPTIALKDKVADYTGSPIKIGGATVTGVHGEPLTSAITYKYYRDKALTKPLSGPPTDGGTYYVTASVEASGNYEALTSGAAKLEIVGGEEEEEEEEEEEREEPVTQIVTIGGVAIELVAGPTDALTINGAALEGALVDGSGAKKTFTARIELVERVNPETGLPEIAQAILFIAAEPDLDENGEPVLGEDGNPVYSQRNLQLGREWIQQLSALGITDICYTLGDAGLMLPLGAFEVPALSEGTNFSVRIAPIYEGELRPSEEAALSGYIAVSGLYRAYISMETEGGEADITALLAGATLRLPAEADIPEEELAKYGALFAPNEGAAALLAAAYGEGPSADGVARQYWTSALSGRGLYALVAAG